MVDLRRMGSVFKMVDIRPHPAQSLTCRNALSMLTIAVVQKSIFRTSLMFLLPAIRMSPGTDVDHSVPSVKVS